jgi:drug/metabolite transporter (DMT)-like permease
MQSSLTRTLLHVGILLIGTLAGSTAVIMIKASTEHPLLVASYRLLIAAFVLTPVFIHELVKPEADYGWKQFRWTILPSVVLATHFITWVIGARATPVTNASLIINLTPIAMPFFIWIFYQEKVTRPEIMGTILALTGVIILTGGDLKTTRETLPGDLICFLSMLTFTCYFALGRKNNNRLNLWLYVVPMYYLSGILCLIVGAFFINPIKQYTLENILYLIGLGIIPTVIGHTLYNYSLKHLRGQVVSVINLSQPFFAAFLGYIFLGEVPVPIYYLAAALVLIGAIIAILYNPNNSAKSATKQSEN